MRRRKLFLPLFIIFLILLGLGVNQLRQLNFDLSLLWSGREKIASPLPPLSQEGKLEEILNKYGLKSLDFKIDGQEAVAKISEVQVFFNLEKEIESQVLSLQFILSRAKIEGRLPKVVDLRFDKPVVSY